MPTFVCMDFGLNDLRPILPRWLTDRILSLPKKTLNATGILVIEGVKQGDSLIVFGRKRSRFRIGDPVQRQVTIKVPDLSENPQNNSLLLKTSYYDTPLYLAYDWARFTSIDDATIQRRVIASQTDIPFSFQSYNIWIVVPTLIASPAFSFGRTSGLLVWTSMGRLIKSIPSDIRYKPMGLWGSDLSSGSGNVILERRDATNYPGLSWLMPDFDRAWERLDGLANDTSSYLYSAGLAYRLYRNAALPPIISDDESPFTQLRYYMPAYKAPNRSTYFMGVRGLTDIHFAKTRPPLSGRVNTTVLTRHKHNEYTSLTEIENVVGLPYIVPPETFLPIPVEDQDNPLDWLRGHIVFPQTYGVYGHHRTSDSSVIDYGTYNFLYTYHEHHRMHTQTWQAYPPDVGYRSGDGVMPFYPPLRWLWLPSALPRWKDITIQVQRREYEVDQTAPSESFFDIVFVDGTRTPANISSEVVWVYDQNNSRLYGLTAKMFLPLLRGRNGAENTDGTWQANSGFTSLPASMNLSSVLDGSLINSFLNNPAHSMVEFPHPIEDGVQIGSCYWLDVGVIPMRLAISDVDSVEGWIGWMNLMENDYKVNGTDRVYVSSNPLVPASRAKVRIYPVVRQQDVNRQVKNGWSESLYVKIHKGSTTQNLSDLAAPDTEGAAMPFFKGKIVGKRGREVYYSIKKQRDLPPFLHFRQDSGVISESQYKADVSSHAIWGGYSRGLYNGYNTSTPPSMQLTPSGSSSSYSNQVEYHDRELGLGWVGLHHGHRRYIARYSQVSRPQPIDRTVVHVHVRRSNQGNVLGGFNPSQFPSDSGSLRGLFDTTGYRALSWHESADDSIIPSVVANDYQDPECVLFLWHRSHVSNVYNPYIGIHSTPATMLPHGRMWNMSYQEARRDIPINLSPRTHTMQAFKEIYAPKILLNARVKEIGRGLPFYPHRQAPLYYVPPVFHSPDQPPIDYPEELSLLDRLKGRWVTISLYHPPRVTSGAYFLGSYWKKLFKDDYSLTPLSFVNQSVDILDSIENNYTGAGLFEIAFGHTNSIMGGLLYSNYVPPINLLPPNMNRRRIDIQGYGFDYGFDGNEDVLMDIRNETLYLTRRLGIMPFEYVGHSALKYSSHMLFTNPSKVPLDLGRAVYSTSEPVLNIIMQRWNHERRGTTFRNGVFPRSISYPRALLQHGGGVGYYSIPPMHMLKWMHVLFETTHLYTPFLPTRGDETLVYSPALGNMPDFNNIMNHIYQNKAKVTDGAARRLHNIMRFAPKAHPNSSLADRCFEYSYKYDNDMEHASGAVPHYPSGRALQELKKRISDLTLDPYDLKPMLVRIQRAPSDFIAPGHDTRHALWNSYWLFTDMNLVRSRWQAVPDDIEYVEVPACGWRVSAGALPMGYNAVGFYDDEFMIQPLMWDKINPKRPRESGIGLTNSSKDASQNNFIGEYTLNKDHKHVERDSSNTSRVNGSILIGPVTTSNYLWRSDPVRASLYNALTTDWSYISGYAYDQNMSGSQPDLDTSFKDFIRHQQAVTYLSYVTDKHFHLLTPTLPMLIEHDHWLYQLFRYIDLMQTMAFWISQGSGNNVQKHILALPHPNYIITRYNPSPIKVFMGSDASPRDAFVSDPVYSYMPFTGVPTSITNHNRDINPPEASSFPANHPEEDKFSVVYGDKIREWGGTGSEVPEHLYGNNTPFESLSRAYLAFPQMTFPVVSYDWDFTDFYTLDELGGAWGYYACFMPAYAFYYSGGPA